MKKNASFSVTLFTESCCDGHPAVAAHPPPPHACRLVHEPHLVVQRQVTERWDVLGPFHQDQQLLLHGLTHVCDGGDLFGSDVAVQDGCRRRDLGGARSLV